MGTPPCGSPGLSLLWMSKPRLFGSISLDLMDSSSQVSVPRMTSELVSFMRTSNNLPFFLRLWKLIVKILRDFVPVCFVFVCFGDEDMTGIPLWGNESFERYSEPVLDSKLDSEVHAIDMSERLFLGVSGSKTIKYHLFCCLRRFYRYIGNSVILSPNARFLSLVRVTHFTQLVKGIGHY